METVAAVVFLLLVAVSLASGTRVPRQQTQQWPTFQSNTEVQSLGSNWAAAFIAFLAVLVMAAMFLK